MVSYKYYEVATRDSIIDEDNNGLFVKVPSEDKKGILYTVRCKEHATGVTVVKCNCDGYYYRKSCKHALIVAAYWKGIYKHNTASNTKKYQERIKLESQKKVKSFISKAQESKGHLNVSNVQKRNVYWDENRACECYCDNRKPTGNMEGIDFGSTPMRWNFQDECFEEMPANIRDIGSKGSLNGNKGFSLLRA